MTSQRRGRPIGARGSVQRRDVTRPRSQSRDDRTFVIVDSGVGGAFGPARVGLGRFTCLGRCSPLLPRSLRRACAMTARSGQIPGCRPSLPAGPAGLCGCLARRKPTPARERSLCPPRAVLPSLGFAESQGPLPLTPPPGRRSFPPKHPKQIA